MTTQASQAARDSAMTANSRIMNQPPGALARSPKAVTRTSCLATAITPGAEAATASSTPKTSSPAAGRRQRPAGSFPSGNTQSRIATKTRNSGHSSSNTADTQANGTVPGCIRYARMSYWFEGLAPTNRMANSSQPMGLPGRRATSNVATEAAGIPAHATATESTSGPPVPG